MVMTDSGEKNNILNGVEISGTIRFSKELTFDGILHGDISSHEGTLIVGSNGQIHGNVQSSNVVVKGKVDGNITAEDRCELQGGAELVGDLKTARLVLEAGAMFVGKSEVNPSKGAASAPSSTKATAPVATAPPVAIPTGESQKASALQQSGTLPGIKV
jgi:cytoskeletal protein CcmA (bactofilin family)